jgi:hypothetical protein
MLALILASVLSLNGRCNYVAALGPALVGETRAICDHVEVSGADDGTMIEFRHRSTTQWMRFTGVLDGNRMTVRSVASTRVEERPAHGFCQIFRKEERVRAVSCVVQAGARSFVANFEPPAL